MEERKKKLLVDQYNKTQEHLAVLKSQVDELKKQEEEREEMLCQIFDGDYGSEKEQELEIKVCLSVSLSVCQLVCLPVCLSFKTLPWQQMTSISCVFSRSICLL
jgi:hypothetical protein